jgi:triosephosphate isomerase
LVRALRTHALPLDVDVVVCPPFTALSAVADELRGSHIALGAQTMHEMPSGAFTGEISPVMLRELGVTYVILGHSERRQHFGETDESIARKTRSALEHGITPIVAVGETAHEHERGETYDKVLAQTRAALRDLKAETSANVVIAYEPVWAIGTGAADEPAEADGVMQRIRSSIPPLRDARILYGGSMKGENAAALMAQPNIDGGLIGGASLSASAFTAIIDAAHASPAAR